MKAWYILGNLVYNRDKEISKSYSEIKELIRKLLLKEPNSLLVSTIISSLEKRGFKDCNLFTVLKAIDEVVQEENTDSKNMSIYIKEMEIGVDGLPF